ncbi:hypothetical protein [Shewanella sp. WXL01]|uniref:hypothetical protein n=1 Tax=Shewanella sp. WXL01 TaxID=2709721 RepID=UPI001FD909B9|nr:hypothetical protein [Shewanella sp. WXL01]
MNKLTHKIAAQTKNNATAANYHSEQSAAEQDEHKQTWFDFLQRKGTPMNILPSLLAISVISLLSACGGGGGGGESPAPVANTPTSTGDTDTGGTGDTDTGGTDEGDDQTPPEEPTPPEEEEPTPDPTSLDDLVVDADFEMQAVFELEVQVALTNGKRGYFSLCDDFTQGANITVNYESCLLRGPLDNGQLNDTLKVANHQASLMAVVWFYDGSEPQYQSWQYDSQVEQQQLTFN